MVDVLRDYGLAKLYAPAAPVFSHRLPQKASFGFQAAQLGTAKYYSRYLIYESSYSVNNK
jgi:hypothetical protein